MSELLTIKKEVENEEELIKKNIISILERAGKKQGVEFNVKFYDDGVLVERDVNKKKFAWSDNIIFEILQWIVSFEIENIGYRRIDDNLEINELTKKLKEKYPEYVFVYIGQQGIYGKNALGIFNVTGGIYEDKEATICSKDKTFKSIEKSFLKSKKIWGENNKI